MILQFTESDIRTQPLGMMIEETLTPESLHATFFAQPEVEIEDEYHHSVSSMDGFTLSRSSSQGQSNVNIIRQYIFNDK